MTRCIAVLVTLVMAVVYPAFACVPAVAQDASDGSLLPSPLDAQSDCGTGAANSPHGYADASPADAADLLTDRFPCIIDSLADEQAAFGDGSPTDLSLQKNGDAYYKAANPLVPLALPADLGGDVMIGDRGVGVEMGATDPGAAVESSAAPRAESGLFYADTAPAVDLDPGADRLRPRRRLPASRSRES